METSVVERNKIYNNCRLTNEYLFILWYFNDMSSEPSKTMYINQDAFGYMIYIDFKIRRQNASKEKK